MARNGVWMWLLVWAGLIEALGRSQTLAIVGLTVTAVLIWYHGRYSRSKS